MISKLYDQNKDRSGMNTLNKVKNKTFSQSFKSYLGNHICNFSIVNNKLISLFSFLFKFSNHAMSSKSFMSLNQYSLLSN